MRPSPLCDPNVRTAVHIQCNDLVGKTPDDLAVWAALHGCEGAPEEITLVEGRSSTERPTIALAPSGCSAPLLAIGFESPETDAELAPIYAATRDLLAQELGW